MRTWVAIWGVVGLVAIIADALVRLSLRAAEALTDPELGAVHIAFAAAWVPLMVYVEGVRAFQRGFAPRAATRAVGLAKAHGRCPGLVALAPLVCAGLLHATRRRLCASWGVVFGVVTLVLIIGHLPQPWRGLVDLGVVAALSWGVLRMLIDLRRALRGADLAVTADFPEGSPAHAGATPGTELV